MAMPLSTKLPKPVCMNCGNSLDTKANITAMLCPACMVKAQTILVQKNAISQRLNQFSRKVRTIKAPHISELCEEMIEQFGSLKDMAKAWKQQIDAACANRPGGKTALDAFGALSHLVRESTVLRGSAPDVENLSEEDIEREMTELVGRMLAADNENLLESIERSADMFDVLASPSKQEAVEVPDAAAEF